MENNVIKENQLEVLPKNEIATIVELNNLPVAKDKKELLPTIIRKEALALVEIKKEFYNVKKQRSIYGLAWFLKKVAVLCAKLIRYLFLGVTRLVSFVMFSVIVILSTTIITRNVVNSLYGVRATEVDGTGFSIFSVKDDEEAKAHADMMESKSDESRDNTSEQMEEKQSDPEVDETEDE
ncbi:MAG: hypothetical protein IJH12_00335 [Clostridia bacterium]|nr:hypothetical protein [Clostridia bacterium]